MRAWLLTVMGVFCCLNSNAQTYFGLSGGINSVAVLNENPAFAYIEDRAQINFCSIGTEIGGNSILFKKSAFSFLTNGKIAPGNGYARNSADQQKMFWGNIDIMGPGAILRVKKRFFCAITTGTRYLVNSDNLDSKVYKIMGANSSPGTQPDTFKINNYSGAAQVFNEVNLTYAGFLHETEDYKLVAGATLKILDGISAAGLGIPSATFTTINNDGIAHNLTGTANIAFTPYSNKWVTSNDPFNALRNPSNNIGAGADLGMVYYMNPNDAMTLLKGYKTRFAISVTDIGNIAYTSSSTSATYTINNKFINYRGIDNSTNLSFGNRIFNDFLIDTVASSKGSQHKFKVGLPTALHANVDFKVIEHLFLDANLLVNLRKPTANMLSNHYITTFTVTPRYDFGRFGVSLPVSENALQQTYIGAVIYAGPVYIGSGSLFQMILSNSFNNANLFIGCSLKLKPPKQKYKDMMMM